MSCAASCSDELKYRPRVPISTHALVSLFLLLPATYILLVHCVASMRVFNLEFLGFRSGLLATLWILAVIFSLSTVAAATASVASEEDLPENSGIDL